MTTTFAQFKAGLEEFLYGTTEKGCCIQCKQLFSEANTHTAAGWKETNISKLCEDCFDNITLAGEEE
jgi:hypothetical protein